MIMKKSAIALASLLLVACADKHNDQDQDQVMKLEAEIKSLRTTLAYQIENNPSEAIKHKEELVESLDSCQASVKKVFLYSYDKSAFKIALLEFFQLSNVSKGKDAYDMLSSLGLCFNCVANKTDITKYNFYSLDRFSYTLNSIDRSAKNIERIFNENKQFIFEALDKYRYFNSQAALFTDGLLRTHENIIKSPDYLEWISEFQKKEVTKTDKRAELVIIFEQKFGAIDDLLVLNSINNDYAKIRMKYWLYSFWLRRFAEDNMNTAHAILVDIKAHYGENL